MPRLRHSALVDCAGVRLSEAELSDREKVAILLQGSALLSHLHLAGESLVTSWDAARVDERGLLRGLTVWAVTGDELPQARMHALATLLFRADRLVAGRGEARRVTRDLMHSWTQRLMPVAPDEVVRQILDSADFLWAASRGAARSSLAAEHRSNGTARLWVAGPEWFRRPLLRECSSLAALEARLESQEASDLWRITDKSPDELLARRKWRAAVAAWRGQVRRGAEERLAFSSALAATGRYSEAVAELHRLRRPQARVLRARCLSRLGELRRAKRELAYLESSELEGEDLFEAAAVALRVYVNLGLGDRADRWLRRAARGARSTAGRYRAELLAFEAAWDRGDEVAMRRCLDAARPATETDGLAWRWHKARGLASIECGDGGRAVASLRDALVTGRSLMSPVEAGDLWNEMALARSLTGDLEGGERALRHTLRLHRDAEGPRRTTLTLFNLAEIRLRRGRLVGVREILEHSTAENRKAGNSRGLAHDFELWARYELARGRPGAAVERLMTALDELESKGVDWRKNQLRVLLARALGWLGRQEAAAEALARCDEGTVADLEPEERPALWALAGDRERALGCLENGPSAAVWRAVLTGGVPAEEAWGQTSSLEPYRLARLVFDLESVHRGCVPGSLVRRAVAVLRQAGIGVLAEQLEKRETGPWRALESYLAGERGRPEAIAALFREAGYGEVRVAVREGGEETVIVAGVGGAGEVTRSLASGELVVSMSWTDTVVRVLAATIARDLERSRPARSAGCAPNLRFGMVGDARPLREAMERLVQLASEPVPILLNGETGTGKELAARGVHDASPRASGPFVPLNCAAVSEELLMSDLFGHVRGAYTGAVKDRMGVFEAAKAGTVFLDEIGDLPLRAQGFLLRVLQEGEVCRVGESLARPTDVRVVTATHRDLEEMVQRGDFRADLYFRLRVASVVLPPLRDRGKDVLLLARHFLNRLRPGEAPGLTASARRALAAHDWPGNVRELQNVLSVAVALAESGTIDAAHLELPSRGSVSAAGYHEQVLELRRRLVDEALEASGGNRAEAARRLGVTRQALSYLVRKLAVGEYREAR